MNQVKQPIAKPTKRLSYQQEKEMKQAKKQAISFRTTRQSKRDVFQDRDD